MEIVPLRSIFPRQLLGFWMDSGEGRAAFEWICIRYIMVDVETYQQLLEHI